MGNVKAGETEVGGPSDLLDRQSSQLMGSRVRDNLKIQNKTKDQKKKNTGKMDQLARVYAS